jgi:hypothetical protein
MCFMLLFRDLIRLFACYNDAIINLLEKYFDMNKKQCRDALDLYKKFLTRMDRVGEFLKVAEVSSTANFRNSSEIDRNSPAEHRNRQRRHSRPDEGTELVAGGTRTAFKHTRGKEGLSCKHTNAVGEVVKRSLFHTRN